MLELLKCNGSGLFHVISCGGPMLVEGLFQSSMGYASSLAVPMKFLGDSCGQRLEAKVQGRPAFLFYQVAYVGYMLALKSVIIKNYG